MNAECKLCLFWFADEPTRNLGLCKRRAPCVTAKGATRWPLTDKEDQCGEFEYKPEAQD